MTVRDEDVEYAFDDPDEGWFGMAQPVDVAPARPVEEPAPEHWTHDESEPSEPAEVSYYHQDPSEDTDRWFVQDMALAAPVERGDPPRADVDDRRVAESVAATLNVVPTRRNGFVKASAPASWESRLSNSGAWDFKATSKGTRLPSRRTAMAAVAIVAAVLAIVGIVVTLRSPGPAVDQPAPLAPSESAAPATPTTSVPAPVADVPLLPPPPPPGPPPSAEELSPPVVTRQYTPTYQTPDQPKKPQTNVTRTPMSATPPLPPRQTNQGHATPGDSNGGCRGFFC